MVLEAREDWMPLNCRYRKVSTGRGCCYITLGRNTAHAMLRSMAFQLIARLSSS